MDRFAGQLISEGAVDELMLPHSGQTSEGLGHDIDLEMVSTTGEILNLHPGIGQSSADGVLDPIGMHHRSRLEGRGETESKGRWAQLEEGDAGAPKGVATKPSSSNCW